MSSPESIGRIVTRFSRLKQLTAHAERLGELDAVVRTCLPQPLARHLHLAAIRDGCLVLHADSPAWAAQARFKAPEILARLGGAPELADVRSVRVRNARRERARQGETRPAARALSSTAAADISAQAEHVADADVRAALMRLTRHRRG